MAALLGNSRIGRVLMSSYSSVFRIKKLHSLSQIQGAGSHNLRDRPPVNADQARSGLNRVLIGSGKTPEELVNARIGQLQIKPFSSSVLAIECVMSAGKPFFSKVSQDQWIQDSFAFLGAKFGRDNIVHATLHLDEETPHLHAIVLPAVPANDKDGKSYKNHKKRKWKLGAKSILHSLADSRPFGPRRSDSSLFSQSDILDIKKLSARLFAQVEPMARYLWMHLPVETKKTLVQCSRSTRKDKAARTALIKGLNTILQTKNMDGIQTLFAASGVSPEVKKFRAQDAGKNQPIRLNRMLIEDAFPAEISTKRRIGAESAPFLHTCQRDYYKLCQKLDPQISEPLYRINLSHQELTQWNGMVDKALKTNTAKIDVKFDQPGYRDLLQPRKYIEDQTEKILSSVNAALALTQAKAAQCDLLAAEKERLQEGVRLANRQNDQKIADLQTQVADLAQQNKELLAKLRTIPLEAVLAKLGHKSQIKDGKLLFQLPDDRVISVEKQRFTELTAVGGMGALKARRTAGGAIDLVIWITGWDMDAARRWLAKNFTLQETLATECERVAEDLAPKLQAPHSQEEMNLFNSHKVLTYKRAQEKWPVVRKWLIDENALAPQNIDELYAANRIWANAFGSVVFTSITHGKVVEAIVMGTTPNSLTGSSYSDAEGSTDAGYVLGNPNSNLHALVSSPLEALSYSQLFPSACVTSTNGNPSQKLLRQLSDAQATKDNNAVLLAFPNNTEGNIYADVAEKILEKAGTKTLRQPPPTFHPNAKGWNDLLRASRGKLSRYSDVSLTTALQCLQIAQEWITQTIQNLRPRKPR
ncbi:MAG: plasmid recombination protein [Verrucomicrobiota bacterium]